MKYRTAKQVKQALLNGVEVKINRWAALINKNDEIEIWDPKGKGVVASLIHLDKAVKDFYRVAQGIPEKMPKPVTYESTPSGSGPLGDDTSQDKPWTDPKVNKQPVMQGPTSDPDLEDDTSQDPPWTDPAVNTRPQPNIGEGGLPDTDLGKDTQKNKVEWEDKLTGPEVFRMAKDRKKRASDAEGLASWLEGVVILKGLVGGNYSDFGGDLDMGEDVVHVAIVHDGSGFNPGAALHFSHGSEDEALQQAYESLETDEFDRLSDEERQEMWDTEDKEGYNPVTESYDGRVFTMTPEEFKKVIEGVQGINRKELDVIEFEYPEEEDEEDFDIEASRRIRRRSQDMDPGSDGQSEMGTSDPDSEFYPEIEYESHQIENKGEEPSNLPNDLGGRNNARKRKARENPMFNVSITYSAWDDESLEIGDTDDKGYELEDTPMDLEDIKNEAERLGIDTPTYGMRWWYTSYPEENRDIETGVITNYEMHIENEDGSALDDEQLNIINKLITGSMDVEEALEFLGEPDDDDFEMEASRKGFVDTFAKEAQPGPSYQTLVNASPSRDLLTNIADPEKWASTQAVRGFASGMGRGLYKDPEGKRDKANKGMSNMRGKDPDEVEAGCDYPEKKDKKKARRRKAGPRLKENWTTDGGYSRDIEAESPEELYHLTRSFGSEDDYDWSSISPQREVIEDPGNGVPVEARNRQAGGGAGIKFEVKSYLEGSFDLIYNGSSFDLENLEPIKIEEYTMEGYDEGFTPALDGLQTLDQEFSFDEAELKAFYDKLLNEYEIEVNDVLHFDMWIDKGDIQGEEVVWRGWVRGRAEDFEVRIEEPYITLTTSDLPDDEGNAYSGISDDYGPVKCEVYAKLNESGLDIFRRFFESDMEDDEFFSREYSRKKAVDDYAKSYWKDYFNDYGEDLVKDDSTKKNRKEYEPKVDETPKPAGQQSVKARRRTRRGQDNSELIKLIEKETGEKVEVDSDGQIFVYSSEFEDFYPLSDDDLEFYQDKLEGIEWVYPSGKPYKARRRRTRAQAAPYSSLYEGEGSVKQVSDIIDALESIPTFMPSNKEEAIEMLNSEYPGTNFSDVPEDIWTQVFSTISGSRLRRAQAAPPEAAPPGGQMQNPETAPQAPPQAPAAPAAPAKPEKAPGAGDEGLKALGWTPEEIKLMSDDDKQKILQIQLKKPGTGAAQAPTAPKAPAKPAPEAPQAGPAPMPAQPEQGMPAPTARRVTREAKEKYKIAKAFWRLRRAQAPVETGQTPPAPQTSPGQPVQTGPQNQAPPAAPAEPAVADEFAGETSTEFTPETEAMSIYNEILQKEVKASSPEQVPALKSQELVQRLLTEVGMPMTEARQLFGLKSGDGFNKLFQ